eukprot:6210522-Pleurochrysis_carterae.AAC.1
MARTGYSDFYDYGDLPRATIRAGVKWLLVCDTNNLRSKSGTGAKAEARLVGGSRKAVAQWAPAAIASTSIQDFGERSASARRVHMRRESKTGNCECDIM